MTKLVPKPLNSMKIYQGRAGIFTGISTSTAIADVGL